MVSFSCEACGDVLTKKKLDPHRNQCRGASFTCIDCMVHFQGTSYRSHTSCMSEAQKYQGALYREKPAKNGRKGNNNNNQNGNKNDNNSAKTNTSHRAPYIEDAPDSQVNLVSTVSTTSTSNGTTSAPAQEGTKVNVFDFLVDEKTPNASKVSLAEPKEQMKMKDHAPSVFERSQSSTRAEAEEGDENKDYEENGFTYGSGPIQPPVYPNKDAAVSQEFMTPAPKKKKDRRTERKQSPPALTATSSDKKRKRRTDDHDMEDADTPMLEAPSSVLNHPGTPMLHSGLTGGLDRMLRSPSLDGEDDLENPRRRYQDPSSPLKRTRRDEKEGHGDAGLGISIKNRAERLVSSMFAGSSVSGSSVAGNEAEPRKSKKTHKVRYDDQAPSSEALKTKRKSSAQMEADRPSRRVKKYEYPDSPRDNGRDMVVYRQENHPNEAQRQMAAHFLSLVTKGPESTRGFSVNKVLKRFHKDFSDDIDGDRGRGQGRSRADREQRLEDEKDLWRTLRLKQNERGEIVLFF
ncbi:hypothetical protein AN3760.2 [Aspergillus nidulans FGSC A4]|uniref:Conserved hypothetical portein (AFU_orthologue AFUA_7G04700) n=1 Tax=Emericella nidulans (strain FGSC A4 / ATCC 38163 / CBS 112.46 / NRRL 194 / M139) TaxID=227321 RepID=Q5B6S0_EMENI|nr:hypothetical protein [Aspergillus nidulans FGSC A4]EAA59968.1 hypothetical protein AN3760.2 [Aspergillus nidulans FGSC A4]CBF75450.1 TPA: conserved hypothetical portein (AFU_orthologue; AFUA_7G04700) [Aspergillus nidulans FGSC A4]|eukprot:XP_661364.1 hypothetical protein AN3760.2 [Aspergillus nidulans FGSC A4]